jgi:hypothetical protein
MAKPMPILRARRAPPTARDLGEPRLAAGPVFGEARTA